MNFIVSIFALILLINTTHNQIISVAQSDNCPHGQTNFQGNCFNTIPGCQIYKNDAECLKCEQNSSLNDGKCFLTMKNEQILLLTYSKPKPSSSKGLGKQFKMTFTDQVNYNSIKNIIVSKYPLFANVQNEPILKNVLKSSFETYFSITWVNSKNKTQLFEYSVDYNGMISELIADEYDPNLQNSLFWKISTKSVQKYNQQLIDSTLTRILSISRNLYKLHYYTDFGFHYVVFVQKIPYLEIKPLQTISWKYDQQEMLNYIYSQHPFLVNQQSWQVKKRQNTKTLQYEVKFKSQSQVVLQQFPLQRQRIVFFHRQENQTLALNAKLVGGYQTLRYKQDDILKKVLNHLFSEFTILQNTEISKIQYQVVAGTNYLIHLKDKSNTDEYLCKVFYSLTGQINILQIYLNLVLIHTQPLAPLQSDQSYMYQTDPLFSNVINYIKNVKNFSVPEQILYVNKVKKTNDINTFYQFQIVYEPNSFIVASYFIDGPKNGSIELNDFIYNGDNEYDSDLSLQKEQIQHFLEQYRRWMHPLAVQYIKQTKPNQYLLKIITEYGSYFFKIIDTEVTDYQIYYYQLIDQNQHCMAHSKDQLNQFLIDQKSFITSLINSNKIDPASQLVSFYQGILSSKTRYRLLFVNPTNSKKSQVFVKVDQKGLTIDSIQEQNNGSYIITDTGFYAKAIQKSIGSFGDMLKNCKAIYGMMNSNNVFIYFSKASSSKQSVLLITLDAGLNKPNMSIFMQQQISKTCNKLDPNSGECLDCKQGSIVLMSACYDRIKNCKKQIGNICLICQDQYSLIDGNCLNNCGLFM